MLFTAAYQRVRLNIEVDLSKKFYGKYRQGCKWDESETSDNDFLVGHFLDCDLKVICFASRSHFCKLDCEKISWLWAYFAIHKYVTLLGTRQSCKKGEVSDSELFKCCVYEFSAFIYACKGVHKDVVNFLLDHSDKIDLTKGQEILSNVVRVLYWNAWIIQMKLNYYPHTFFWMVPKVAW